ncbi:uncharacterized protein MONOS_18451 [Monocercomonoides exilis]|uniref:uncharacterized protein n=1 Tax=Monocercomonoides exilis TaxID=2049356 RepID=UPI00355A05FD|nr:hypothetical protein MONOS_18451 [Monocercomonoides exilis]
MILCFVDALAVGGAAVQRKCCMGNAMQDAKVEEVRDETINALERLTEKLQYLCFCVCSWRVFRGRKFGAGELAGISKEMCDLLWRCVGRMESVPAYILRNVLHCGKVVLSAGADDRVAASYVRAMALVVDVRSYPVQHRRLRLEEVQLTAQEKRHVKSPRGKEKQQTKTVLTSDVVGSPLLQEVIFDGEVVPAVVERIHAAESEEALSALAKVVLGFVRIADQAGLAAMVGQHILDGIDTILMRCQERAGLIDAVEALQLVFAARTNITLMASNGWGKAFEEHCFEGVLTEIAVGNKSRGVAREKINLRAPYYERVVDVELEEGRERFEEEDVGKLDDGESVTEQAADSGRGTEESKGEKGRAKEGANRRQREQKRKGGKSAAKEKERLKAKWKQKGGKRKQEEGRVAEVQRKEQRLPFCVRLEAACAVLWEKDHYRFNLPVKKLAGVLAEGIALPEGAEAEYVKRKQKLMESEKSRLKREGSEMDVNIRERDGGDGEAEGVLESKLNIPHIYNCIYCLNVLFSDWDTKYYCGTVRKAEAMPDEQLEAIVNKLLRLNRHAPLFPDKLFFRMSSHCLESICMLYRQQMKRLYGGVFEQRLMEELDEVEMEMEKAAEAGGGGADSEEYINIYSQEYMRSIWEEAPFSSIREPVVGEYESVADYTLDKMQLLRMSFLERRTLQSDMSSVFCCSRLGWLHGRWVNRNLVSVRRQHSSWAALRFNHTLSCIAATCAAQDASSDDVVTRPFFRRLVGRLVRPFALQVPFGVGSLSSVAYQQHSLESVQSTIDLFALEVLTNVEKELGFVFEEGYVGALFGRLAGSMELNSHALYVAVQVIRETCIAFMRADREARVKAAGVLNASIAEWNRHGEGKEAAGRRVFLQIAPRLHKTWQQVEAGGLLGEVGEGKEVGEVGEGEKGEKGEKGGEGGEGEKGEKGEKGKKGEDVGVVLLRLVDDTIEERGIRDCVEATPQHNDVQLFWRCSGSLPSKNRVQQVSLYSRGKVSDVEGLPYAEFVPIPSDPLSAPDPEAFRQANYRMVFLFNVAN